MTFQRQISRARGTRVKRALGVQAALEWTFRIEKAQLELPLPKEMKDEVFGFGLEYVLLQRAALGCKVDGGQHKMGSYTHPDAEVIAATVAGIPDSLGGIRMAIRVAELARAGLTPDWMPGPFPAACRSKPSRTSMANALPPSWWASNVCCIAGAGAPLRFWHALSPGDRIRNRSPPPGAAMKNGGRRWIGCETAGGRRDAQRSGGNGGNAKAATMENRVTASQRARSGLSADLKLLILNLESGQSVEWAISTTNHLAIGTFQ